MDNETPGAQGELALDQPRRDDENLPAAGTKIEMALDGFDEKGRPIKLTDAVVVAVAGKDVCFRIEGKYRAELTVYGMSSEFEYWWRKKT